MPHERISLALPTEPLAWKELIAAVPIVVSVLAVTYDIGFFLETDFSFFSLFSLTEHITFALEAVPMATAAAALVLSQFQTDTWIGAGWSERRQRLYRLAQASFVFVLGSIMLYTTYPVLPQILIVIVTLAVFLIYLQAAKHQLTGMRIALFSAFFLFWGAYAAGADFQRLQILVAPLEKLTILGEEL